MRRGPGINTEMAAKLAELRAEVVKNMGEMRTKLRTYGESQLHNFFNLIFEARPEINTISWTQYTPYFNDGDTCNFSCHSDYPSINGYDSDSGEYEGDEEDEETFPHNSYYYERIKGGTKEYDWRTISYKVITPGRDLTPEEEAEYAKVVAREDFLSEQCKFVGGLLGTIDDDIYMAIWGDHVRVTAKRDGTFEVEEYQHD